MVNPRVHEVAKELGVPSLIVMAEFDDIGHPVKSASSTVDPALAGRVIERLRSRHAVEQPAGLAAQQQEPPVAVKEPTRPATLDRAPAPVAAFTPQPNAGSYTGPQSEPDRQTLPHPIARAWRQYELQSEPLGRFQEGQRLAGVVVQTLGCLAAASSAADAPGSSALMQLAGKLRRQGPSWGDWLAVIREAGDVARRQGSDPFGIGKGTATRKGGRGLITDLEDLIAARNDTAHANGPSSVGEATARLSVVEPQLESVLKSLLHLSLNEWLFVDRCDWRRKQEAFEVSATRLMGDHPDFERTQVWVKDPAESNVVYIIPHEGPLLPMHPFLSVRDCEQCHNSELWVLDRVSSSTVKFRSLTTGHKSTAASLAAEVGMELEVLASAAAMPSRGVAGQGSVER